MNVDIYDKYFNENVIEHCGLNNYLMCTRMAELVVERKMACESITIKKYEEKYVIPNMIDYRLPEEEEYPSPGYVYDKELKKISFICHIMRYKSICFFRYRNSSEETKKELNKAKIIIQDAINKNPYIKYKELIELDRTIDIATQLEHMIEVCEIKITKLSKRNKYGTEKWISKKS